MEKRIRRRRYKRTAWKPSSKLRANVLQKVKAGLQPRRFIQPEYQLQLFEQVSGLHTAMSLTFNSPSEAAYYLFLCWMEAYGTEPNHNLELGIEAFVKQIRLQHKTHFKPKTGGRDFTEQNANALERMQALLEEKGITLTAYEEMKKSERKKLWDELWESEIVYIGGSQWRSLKYNKTLRTNVMRSVNRAITNLQRPKLTK